MASVAKHIRQLRAARHLTQEQLAQRLFVTRQTVSAWETGKAQPDLETLERIAAAMGVAVTEVIYGAAAGPNLGRLKRKWAALGGMMVAILAILIIIYLKNGAYGTWRYGLAYQFHNANYHLSYEDLPGTWTVELDLTDLDSNAGKVLYADETGCRVAVDSVDAYDGEYRVWFRAHGVYDREGGTLVSGCQSLPVEKTAWTMDATASMTAAVGGASYPCSLAGTSGLLYPDGNLFGFHLNPRDADTWEQISIDGMDTLTVTVSGLSRAATQRAAYWDIY